MGRLVACWLVAVLVLVLVFGLARRAGPWPGYDPCGYRADDCLDLSVDHGPDER